MGFPVLITYFDSNRNRTAKFRVSIRGIPLLGHFEIYGLVVLAESDFDSHVFITHVYVYSA